LCWLVRLFMVHKPTVTSNGVNVLRVEFVGIINTKIYYVYLIPLFTGLQMYKLFFTLQFDSLIFNKIIYLFDFTGKDIIFVYQLQIKIWLKKISLLLIILSGLNCCAKKYYLSKLKVLIQGNHYYRLFNYKIEHTDAKAVEEEIRKTRDSLISHGYIETKPFLISELMIALCASVSLGIKIRAIRFTISGTKVKKNHWRWTWLYSYLIE
jgi:hypothetical protein